MAECLSPLATPSATREVLEAHGLATKHALGQNFLVNDAILRKIVDLAALSDADDVLEVGPGIGTLTIALLKCAGRVVAVERDADLPAVLAQTCAPWADRFTLLSKDALALQPDELPFAPAKLVANLPYAVAATVVLDVFERFESVQQATVMVQAEVADRMAAKPGVKDYGAYTVKLRQFAEPAGRFPVSPGNFFPPPRVDSAVIRLDRIECPQTPAARAATCTMADAAFATRRKTIANSCKTFFSGRGAQGKAILPHLAQVFQDAGIDPKRRGETLSLEEFRRLGECALPFLP
ncbi:MAG: 16S rRNA (adenine(1518)-N(6)/adenine(1519)-N(6))-dimethyltransferase RsmA [Coriobacteriaceae bacterium]|nr:16S rRNA (adenine(1518)-N(6)/adenine(1519)-N(6))-dimethyltransferase RsmA [Coriobacteriaceae bacterium]